MKTMKLIDLLIKIANEEGVPEKIRCFGITWEFDKNENNYYDKDGDSLNDIRLIGNLNEKAEILDKNFKLEEIPKISKLYINNELQYNLEEEKKIPEKLGKIEDNDGYIDQYDVIKIGKKVDEIINYLESKEKGE